MGCWAYGPVEPRNRRIVGLRNDGPAGQTWDCSSVGLWAYDGASGEREGRVLAAVGRVGSSAGDSENLVNSRYLRAVILWAYGTVGLRFGLVGSRRGGCRPSRAGLRSSIEWSSSRDAWRSSVSGGASFIESSVREEGFVCDTFRSSRACAWLVQKYSEIKRCPIQEYFGSAKPITPSEADRASRWMHHRVAV